MISDTKQDGRRFWTSDRKAMTRESLSSVNLTMLAPSIRAKAVTAILALVPSTALSQDSQTTATPEPPAASSTDLTPRTLPKAEISPRPPPGESKKLKSGFVVAKPEDRTAYTLDKEGRVLGLRFPSGYTVSDISYHTFPGKEDCIIQLTITSGGLSKVYTRNSYKDTLYQSWKVTTNESRANTALPEFEGNFEITPCGEFVITDFSGGRYDRRLYAPDGQTFLMQQLSSGAYFYLDSNRLPQALRRTDRSLVRISYSNGAPAFITEEHDNIVTRSWTLDAQTKMWQCSDQNILPSTTCPLYEKGTIAFTLHDGARVSIATSGAHTILSNDGLTTVIDPSGKIVRVARGARSRIFSYDSKGNLIAFTDTIGSSGVPTAIKGGPAVRHQVERNGAVSSVRLEAASLTPDALRGQIRFPSPFEAPVTQFVTFPKIQIHPHEPPKGEMRLCLNGVCPDTLPPLEQTGILVPSDAIAIGQESLIVPEVETWTPLDTIEKHRGGAVAPLVEFLRIWAETTSDEDIDRLTSPEALRLLKSDGGVRWIQPELISSTHADYLLWLRECVRANRLPCTLDIKPLSYPGLDNQALFGGVTGTALSPFDRSLRISVDIQLLTFSEAALRADISEILKRGGSGIYRPERFRSASAINTLFHELQHVFVYATGREFEGTEPVAHLGAFLALASITPEKAGRYTKVLERFRR